MRITFFFFCSSEKDQSFLPISWVGFEYKAKKGKNGTREKKIKDGKRSHLKMQEDGYTSLTDCEYYCDMGVVCM